MKVVRVKVLKPVSSNGKGYHPGAEFEMEESLVAPHAAAGLVEPVGEPRALKPGESADESQNAGGVDACGAWSPDAEPEPADPDRQPEPPADQE